MDATSNGLDESELRMLIQHLPYYVVVVDSEANFVWANRFDTTLQPGEVIGRPFDFFTPAEHRAQGRAVVERCLRLREAGYYEVPYGDGASTVWFGCRVVPLPPDANGRPRAMVLASEITERRRAQDALAQSEARFRGLVETSPEFIVIIDRQRRMLYLNHEPPPEWRLSRSDIVGMCVDDLMEPADRTRQVDAIEAAFESGQRCSFDALGARDKRRYRSDVVPLARTPGTDAVALLIARDVTEEWNAARQREAMLTELDHRVKNTLAMVLALAEQLMARATSFDAFRTTFTERLLSLARSHEALAASHWSGVSLADVVRMTLGALGGANLELTPDSDNPQLPPKIVTPLSLALHELSTNALKHGALSAHGGKLQLQSRLDQGTEILLSWQETAPQPADALKEGFGLRLVRGLIEHELGGRLEVKVDPGRRAYRIQIPLGAPA